MSIKESRTAKMDDILEFARKHGSMISYNTAVDILKDRDEELEEALIEREIAELARKGITVTYEQDEGYPAQEVGPDTFIPADVNINQRTMNIYNLMERLEHKEIDLTPGFQRNGDLWSMEKQSQLIESLMLKIPIPAFYFDVKDDDKWVVIDGLQRLSAFENFLVGKTEGENERVKKTFEGMQYLGDFNGLTFDDLPRQYVRRIKETSVIAFTVEKGTPDEVVFNIFQRINTGGVALNDQEIRQALYQGKATELIRKLAESTEFVTATQNAIPSDRMVDREYVTRFLAFTELDYKREYKGNIDNFLIKAMKKINTCEEEQILDIERKFKRVMYYCHMIFGKYAFRKYNADFRRGPVNKAIFELWAVCFSELAEEQLKKLVNQKEKFLQQFGKLLQNSEFVSALKAGDQYSAVRRIDMAKNLVKEFL
mgnify:CR=1 FL=1